MKSTFLKICMLAALALAAACGGIAQKIAPPRIEAVRIYGLTGADVSLAVSNASAHNIRIRKAEAIFHYDGTPIGKVVLLREFTIEKRTCDTLHTRWRFAVKDPAAARLLVRRIESRRYDKIAISYQFAVRMGLIKKTFSGERVPMSDFLATFDRITETAR